jgi:outer membrane lipoprotein carrier protein
MLVPVLLAGLCSAARAGDRVEDYFSGLQTFQAEFSQTVVDASGEQVQNSRGTVWIQRPGRFRWDYRTPYRQLIVADGKQLWTWDEDLEQATVKPVGEALSTTPAMLLSGFRPLSEVMTWREIESQGDYSWFQLDPRQTDAAVQQVEIGFEKDQLTLIEVIDGFGNQTRIRFSDIVRNQPVDADRFRIELPPGTDIIGTTQ